MALIISDRVRETSTTTGTGAVALAGAQPGFQRFSARMSVGDTTWYAITGPNGSWETGIGTYTAANTLTRTTPLESSNGDARVNFAAGTKDVFMTVPGKRAVDPDKLAEDLAGKAGLAVATPSANGLLSSGDKSKLDGVAAGANVTNVASVGAALAAGAANSSPSDSDQIGGVAAGSSALFRLTLGNLRTWLQTSFSTVFAAISHGHAISAVAGLQDALDARQVSSQKGQANGYAGLGSDGRVPAAQLPAPPTVPSNIWTGTNLPDPAQISDFLGGDPATISSGYVKLGSGLLMQWGLSNTNPSDNSSTVFPVAFASAPRVVAVPMGFHNTSLAWAVTIASASANSFTSRGRAITTGSLSAAQFNFAWFAIGVAP